MQQNKKAIVIHSGGMDSSLCLALAIRDFGIDQVCSLSFSYGQRHLEPELQCAAQICRDWGVEHQLMTLDLMPKITSSALIGNSIKIHHEKGEVPNTIVIGRNGLMARCGAIYAHQRGAKKIYMGVIEVESSNCGYRDCSRAYMDLKEKILRIDLGDDEFCIETPLVKMSKKETLELAQELGVLEYLLKRTITCYEGVAEWGCRSCPACILRNQGLEQYSAEHQGFVVPYANI